MQVLGYIGIGLLVGTISGLMGIAGGVVLVPMLMWLCEFPIRKASGTSLAVLAIPVTLPGALKAYSEDHVEVGAILWIAGAFVLSSYLSRSYIECIPELVLRRVFGLLLMYIAVRFILASSSEVLTAAGGLTAVAAAWLGFLFLRTLGRKHMTPPNISGEIRRVQQAGGGETDYYI